MNVKDSRPRPREVSIALLLLAIMWVVSSAFVAWRMLVSPKLVVNGEEVAWQAALISVILLVTVSGGLLAALACRRRWAYVATIILYASSLVSQAGSSNFRQSFDDGPLMVLLWWITPCAIDIAAVVLLLRRPGREWYGFVRKATRKPA
jgi:hypothetical protein